MDILVCFWLPSASFDDLVLEKHFIIFYSSKWGNVLWLKPLWIEIVCCVCRKPFNGKWGQLEVGGPAIFAPGLLDFKQTSMICSNIEIPHFSLNVQHWQKEQRNLILNPFLFTMCNEHFQKKCLGVFIKFYPFLFFFIFNVVRVRE